MIQYCLLSNTFKVYQDFSKKNPITVLKDSPFDSNIFAAGLKNGLILVGTLDKLEIKFKLRGHDSEITCLGWTAFVVDQDPGTPGRSKNLKKKSKAPPKPAPADDDCFDIYSFDHLEEEFGTFAPKAMEQESDQEELESTEKLPANSNFDFIEACQSLKNDILLETNDTVNSNIDQTKDTFEANRNQYGVKNENDSHDESMESIGSSHTPALSDSSINYMEECQRLKELMNENSWEKGSKFSFYPEISNFSESLKFI